MLKVTRFSRFLLLLSSVFQPHLHVVKNYETEESINKLVDDKFAQISAVYIHAINSICNTKVLMTISEPLNCIVVTLLSKNIDNTSDEQKIRFVPLGSSNTSDCRNTVKVRKYFHDCYYNDGLRQYIERSIVILTRLHPQKQLIITGHHNGAASAILCGLRMTKTPSNDQLAIDIVPSRIVSVITFGCPHVGNENFEKIVQHQKKLTVWRFESATENPSFFNRHVGHLVSLSGSGAEVVYANNDCVAEEYELGTVDPSKFTSK
uniref:Fungal lipase-type domain-containing protein n=1 Tax=Corethron hystrix TaxID=216773 RepID=A0A7S1BK88_9STRA|mmetsp:Transcript_30506/g.69833  ORF Transcript_30506/g.69833 Transcript_30506/m.69833 type:complete len:263 (+) Transcript_30506:274-1062(+)